MSETDTPKPYIEIRDIGIAFGKGKSRVQVLEKVHLNIQEGEFVCLIGHSGCGKSTLLNLVAGLYPPSAGSCVVDGSLVKSPGPDRMMVFQNHSLLPWQTIRQNVALAADCARPELNKAEKAEEVEATLEMVGLSHAMDKRPSEVSGGMKQRAGIARALITKPKVLLMDEPFGALDALTRGKLQESLLEIWERNRITVMMVTHDVDEAILLSDRVVMMSNGPKANVAKILDVGLPRPRSRMEAVNHPLYYQYRNSLTRFLHDNKHHHGPKVERDPEEISLGFIPLSDCAPIIMARELGLFEKMGLKVTLSREPTWRAASKGLMEGRNHASMMLAPTPFLHNLENPGKPIQSSMVLSRNGNAITLRKNLQELGIHDRDTLATWIKQQPPNKKPVFGMVFPSSMHNLILQDWLRAGGIDPDHDVEIIVIPPPQMVANLELNNLVGCCVGEPWNSLAIQKGVGFVPEADDALWPSHPEKILTFTREWQKSNPDKASKLTAALMQACAYCANLENRDHIIQTLAQKNAVHLPEETFAFSMRDQFDNGDGHVKDLPGFHQFFEASSTYFHEDEQRWISEKLRQAGVTPVHENFSLIFDETTYREGCALSGYSPAEGPALSTPHFSNTRIGRLAEGVPA